MATAASIRGLGVVIPASIAWKTAATVLEHGRLHRGYLGIVGQPVTIPQNQRETEDRTEAVLITGVIVGRGHQGVRERRQGGQEGGGAGDGTTPSEVGGLLGEHVARSPRGSAPWGGPAAGRPSWRTPGGRAPPR